MMLIRRITTVTVKGFNHTGTTPALRSEYNTLHATISVTSGLVQRAMPREPHPRKVKSGWCEEAKFICKSSNKSWAHEAAGNTHV